MPSAAAASGQASASRRIRAASQPNSSPNAAATGERRVGGAEVGSREQAEAGAAQQHVGDRAGLLETGGDGRLGSEVGEARDDRPRELRSLAGQAQHVAGGVPVAKGEQLPVALGEVGVGESLRRLRSSSVAGMPSGMSAVRQGASRPSARPSGRPPASPSAARW